MSIDVLSDRVPRVARRQAPVALDVQRIRKEFPILHQRVHGKPLIYLDNAATSQKPQAVLDAMRRYYENDNANVHRGVHYLSERATADYEQARVKAQKFLHANCTREIVFTRGTTEAINLVAQTFGRQQVQAGDRIVISAMEHHSNIVPWQMLCQERGAELQVVPVNPAGEMVLEALEQLLTPRTRLLAISHVSNVLGTINPIREIVKIAHEHGVPVFVDGAQAAPHLRIDVQDLDCDFYAFSSHKAYGPTGIGVLYGKAVHLEAMPPWQGGGDMIRSVSFEKTTYNERPYKFEAGTPSIAEAVGLGAAIDYLESVGLETIAAHEHQLLVKAMQQLGQVPGIRLIGTAREKAAVVSFLLEDPPMSPLDLATKLDLEGVAVRNGHHCCQPLMELCGIPGTVRASFGLYNTLEEVDRLTEVLRQVSTAARNRAKASIAPPAPDAAYPSASAADPREAAEKLVEVFEVLDSWMERYEYILELGQKLPPMPAELKTEENRVHGCQSTVFLSLRKRPGTNDVIEFLADSDAEIVRGLLRMLQRLFSGQKAADLMAFDVQRFFGRLGLDQNLTLGRRNGLAEMVKRIRRFAAELASTVS